MSFVNEGVSRDSLPQNLENLKKKMFFGCYNFLVGFFRLNVVNCHTESLNKPNDSRFI